MKFSMLDLPLASNHFMIFRQTSLRSIAKTIMAAAAIASLIACGDPKYQTPAIVVTFSPTSPPPTALETGSTAGIAAVVSNGPENATVSFTCVPSGQCGTFMPDPIASDVPTTYQAPPTVPPGGVVTVTATSVTDPTKSVSAAITIN
jgi:hypothetical protein